MDNSDVVVGKAVDVMTVVGWALGGALVGLAVAVVLLVVLSLLGRKSATFRQLVRRTRFSLPMALSLLGAWAGYGLADVDTEGMLYSAAQHLLLLAMLVAFGWYFFSLTNLVQDVTDSRIEKDARDAKRLRTQAEVLQRVLKSIVVAATIIGCLLTFPGMRAPLASLLASAGVISLVVGLAAQSSLGNMFAGIQLAFTDAIRVGDTVTVTMAGKEHTGTVEELTLTYVVLRIWNERRILMPSSEFTTKPFENWTRQGTEQLGEVHLELDYRVPVVQVRDKVQTLVQQSKLWDGRTWNVQVVEMTARTLTLRVVLSASNPGNRWDLECEIREALVIWINEELPWALPTQRTLATVSTLIGRDPSTATGTEAAAGDPFFSGSEEAEKRAELFSGPGQEAFDEREQVVHMQALDAQGKLAKPSSEPSTEADKLDTKVEE